MIVDLNKRSTGTAANVPLRGVEPVAMQVRDEVQVVDGRMFQFGTNEAIVGRAANRQFTGVDLGSEFTCGQSEDQDRRHLRVRRLRRRRQRSGATAA